RTEAHPFCFCPPPPLLEPPPPPCTLRSCFSRPSFWFRSTLWSWLPRLLSLFASCLDALFLSLAMEERLLMRGARGIQPAPPVRVRSARHLVPELLEEVEREIARLRHRVEDRVVGRLRAALEQPQR